MIRRYSGPRHLTAGCVRPRRPFVTNSIGFPPKPPPPPLGSPPPHHPPPPCDPFRLARLVRHIHELVRRRHHQIGVRLAQSAKRFHVPRVVLVNICLPLCGQKVKGRELQVVDRPHRPA